MKPAAALGRLVVAASLPKFCLLCAGEREVRIVRLDRIRGAGRAQCPHCVSGLPVLHLRFRTDVPRDETA